MSGEATETVIYEYDHTTPLAQNKGTIILGAALVFAGILVAVFGSLIIMKKRRGDCRMEQMVPKLDDDFFEDYELKGMQTSDLTGYEAGDTILLSDPDAGSRSATRLLAPKGAMVTLLDRTDSGRRFDIVLGDTMSIGRGDCDVVITGDDALSKRHCELYMQDEKVFVRDLSSSNGTKVNGRRIDDSELNDGDELSVGARDYLVKIA